MSSALYNVRLLWHGRLGLAKHDGVCVDLTSWPAEALPGLHVAEMDFTPEVRHCEIRESAKGWREMSPDEKRSLMAWLRGLSAPVKAYVEREPADPATPT